MAFKVFIDGQAGTTGLRLADRLILRDDTELIKIDESGRKNIDRRLECIEESDVAFLCLPDEGAAEIVTAIGKAGLNRSRIIDCSSAHRTEAGWKYGIPELFGVDGSDIRVANPGCHATGFIMSVRPLIDAGIVAPDALLSFHSLTGYSGGGKSMIAEYKAAMRGHDAVQSHDAIHPLKAPRQYGFSQAHKHIPEMLKYSGLTDEPVFAPIVCDFYSGMLVSVPVSRGSLRKKVHIGEIRESLSEFYKGKRIVKVRETDYEFSQTAGSGFLSANAFKDRDDIEIIVTGNDDRIEIVSRYDNLGKGASGAAIQNMNLILGMPEDKGLVLGE